MLHLQPRIERNSDGSIDICEGKHARFDGCNWTRYVPTTSILNIPPKCMTDDELMKRIR